MPKLRILSGKEVVKILSNFGFEVVSQKGSHVKLRRVLPEGTKQTLTVPLHDELDKRAEGYNQTGFKIRSRKRPETLFLYIIQEISPGIIESQPLGHSWNLMY